MCSCLLDYTGTPPGCRPECTISTECSRDKACINQKCLNPCIDACGLNTDCRVINHSPICQCKQRYTGDPFTRCNPIQRKLIVWTRKKTFKNYLLFYLKKKVFPNLHISILNVVVSDDHKLLTTNINQCSSCII